MRRLNKFAALLCCAPLFFNAPVMSEESMKKNKTHSSAFRLVEKMAGFKAPTGLAVNHDGEIFVSNWNTGEIIKRDKRHQNQVFAKGLGAPAGLVFDPQGRLYAADYSANIIYRFQPDGRREIFASGLKTPTGLFFSRRNTLLVANRSSDEIVEITLQGKSTVIATGLKTPVGVVESTDGTLYVNNYGGSLSRIKPGGKSETFSSDFVIPGVGISISPQGELWAVDHGDGSLREVAADGSTRKLIENIQGLVGLTILSEHSLYLTGWGKGEIYRFERE